MKRLCLIFAAVLAVVCVPVIRDVGVLMAQSPDSVAATVGGTIGALVSAKLNLWALAGLSFAVKWLATGIEFAFTGYNSLPEWVRAAGASVLATAGVAVNGLLASHGLPSLPLTADGAFAWSSVVVAIIGAWGIHSGLKAIGINPKPVT